MDRSVACKTRRTCAGGPFIHAHSQRTPTPRVNLDRSSQQFGQNGPMAERPGYAEAARIRNRLYKKSGEANGRIHPSQQRRQRSHNPCLRQVKEAHVLIARRDGSGIRILLRGRHLNCGGHCPAGTNSLTIKKKKLAGFRFQESAIPCDRRGVCTVHFTRDFFSHIVMCRTRVAWH